MSKYDFAKRIKALVRRECTLARLDTQCAISAETFKKEMNILQTTINEQNKCLVKATERVEALKQCNEALKKFVHNETRRLQEACENNAKLKEEVQSRIALQKKRRRLMLQQMDKLRFMKESTQTFFNWNAADKGVQGFTVCDTDTTTHLVPFKLPADYTPDEVQQYLWHDTQKNHGPAALNQCWAQLFFGQYHEDVLRGELKKPQPHPSHQQLLNRANDDHDDDYIIID